MSNKIIDLRSDCLNEPTQEMREAMRYAKIGDDDAREDTTINHLEEIAAQKVGKESALFILNGTMANITAIFTHCKQGDKIILEPDMHIYYAEMRGITTITGVIPYIIENISQKSIFNLIDLDIALQGQYAEPLNISLLCLENPHNYWGGVIMEPEGTKKVCQLSHKRGVTVHLDGARIFNAAISLGVDASKLTKYVDSVMVCLNKGLGAPVGAILAGSKEFINEARKNRKMLGGHMRQMGIMAAAGIVALNNMEETLCRENENAKILGGLLSEIEGIKVNLNTIQVNKVVADISGLGMSNDEFSKKLREYNIFGGPKFRIPQGVTLDDIYYVGEKIKELVKK